MTALATLIAVKKRIFLQQEFGSSFIFLLCNCKLCDKTEISIITCRYVNCNERGAQSRGIPYVKYALFSCSKYWSFDQQPWTRMATKELQNWGKTSKMTWFDEQTICLSFVCVSVDTRLDFVLCIKLSKSAKMSKDFDNSFA